MLKMADSQRVFTLGAGFSIPAGMPLATELLPLICCTQTDTFAGRACDGAPISVTVLQ